MNKTFRPYELDQRLLLPPDLREWLPKGRGARPVTAVERHLGQRPAAALADAGYFSEANLTTPALAGVALYV